jgi:hypothetical protein
MCAATCYVTYEGRILSDSCSLAALGIDRDATLIVRGRLLGGADDGQTHACSGKCRMGDCTCPPSSSSSSLLSPSCDSRSAEAAAVRRALNSKRIPTSIIDRVLPVLVADLKATPDNLDCLEVTDLTSRGVDLLSSRKVVRAFKPVESSSAHSTHDLSDSDAGAPKVVLSHADVNQQHGNSGCQIGILGGAGVLTNQPGPPGFPTSQEGSFGIIGDSGSVPRRVSAAEACSRFFGQGFVPRYFSIKTMGILDQPWSAESLMDAGRACVDVGSNPILLQILVMCQSIARGYETVVSAVEPQELQDWLSVQY